MSTHFFRMSGEAYDACQTGIHYAHDGEYPVETGDILIIEKEKVIGIADTWPVAVTIERGHLHEPTEGCTVADALDWQNRFAGRKNLPMDAVERAKKLAAERGWTVRD